MVISSRPWHGREKIRAGDVSLRVIEAEITVEAKRLGKLLWVENCVYSERRGKRSRREPGNPIHLKPEH